MNKPIRSIKFAPFAPVRIVRGSIGIGMSFMWCDAIAAEIKANRTPVVLSVPLLELGEQYVDALRERGITAHLYRGREAANPKSPGEKMCREGERVRRIHQAIG